MKTNIEDKKATLGSTSAAMVGILAAMTLLFPKAIETVQRSTSKVEKTGSVMAQYLEEYGFTDTSESSLVGQTQPDADVLVINKTVRFAK